MPMYRSKPEEWRQAIEETRDRRQMPREIARAMLRPERTLTERVAELERRQAEYERRIAALEQGRRDCRYAEKVVY